MKLVLQDHTVSLDDVQFALRQAIQQSRFTADISPESSRRLKISEVRLRQSKPYCGSHPAACEIGGGRRHRRAKWLEGADWVEFNDLLNDTLDRLHVNANVASTICILRKGRRRRTHYDMYYPHHFGNAQWRYDEPEHIYENWCGKTAPRSTFPEGTPGIYSTVAYAVEG